MEDLDLVVGAIRLLLEQQGIGFDTVLDICDNGKGKVRVRFLDDREDMHINLVEIGEGEIPPLPGPGSRSIH